WPRLRGWRGGLGDPPRPDPRRRQAPRPGHRAGADGGAGGEAGSMVPREPPRQRRLSIPRRGTATGPFGVAGHRDPGAASFSPRPVGDAAQSDGGGGGSANLHSHPELDEAQAGPARSVGSAGPPSPAAAPAGRPLSSAGRDRPQAPPLIVIEGLGQLRVGV